MSHLQPRDDFSHTLADLERLAEVWAPFTGTQEWEFGGRDRVIQEFKALIIPLQSRTPSSMSIGAFERLVAFRQRIIRHNIHDKCFEVHVVDSIRTMITHMVDFKRVAPWASILKNDVPWECRVVEALEAWLKMKNILVASFGPQGALVDLLDTEYIRVFRVNNMQLKDTIIKLEEEVRISNLAIKEFETTIKSSNEQRDDLPLSHAELPINEALLIEELDEVQTLYMELWYKNNELEGEKAALNTDFALTEKSLQGTVRTLKDEIEVLKLTPPPNVATIDSDWKVYDMSFQSETLKSKERLAEAEEDLATTKKANDQLIAEQKGLQDSLATLLCEKAAGAEECENLNISNAALKDSIKLSHRMIDRLKSHCDELEEEANNRGKEKVELALANARLTSSLSEAKDDHAALSESIKKLEADAAKKDIELDQAAEIMSMLTDERGKLKEERQASKEEKARLEEHLAEAVQALDQATSTITATNMHNLTAVNLRLEEELGAANETLGHIRSALLPRSSPNSTVHEANAAHESPGTAAVDLIDSDEDSEWPSRVPIDPWLRGDTESDAWSTMVTPPPSLDINKPMLTSTPSLDTNESSLTSTPGLDTNGPTLSQRSGLDAWSTLLTPPTGLDANGSMLTPRSGLDTNELGTSATLTRTIH